ncbi:alpha/beta fold hydrolase [Streptomyces sp. NPDC059590]|uniref:alpha/beta fold hydrolase n=1 Tax=Streptomyces sp. NPDC059590 TaxID=3346877 RepID=UPI00369EB512
MPELRRVLANGVELNVALSGSGPAVLLLHGFPHTWELWTDVMADLSGRYRVIAPDLRGFGASSRAASGYDAGTAPAFLLALRRPGLVRRLVVMESLLGRLPGAEDFLADGPPWWFGFHSAAPSLAETVLEGHEAAYVDWFLSAGTLGDGVRPALRDAFVRAYTGRQALSCAFSYYRALPESAVQIEQAVATARLTVPTMALGARPVGPALERQLRPVTDDLTGHVIEDCGHIIPLHRPHALLTLLHPFLAGEDAKAA